MKKSLIISILISFSIFSKADNVGRGDTTTVELITFETESVFLQQATPTTDIWQIGQPSKALFNEAYSAPNAIVTDTANSYPINNHSWFDLVISYENFNTYGYFLGIRFKHKLNTSNNSDGGYISVSYDQGITWTNIIEDTAHINSPWDHTPVDNYENINLYTQKDTLFNGKYGFSGDIDEWKKVEFCYYIYPVKKSDYLGDTMIIRFNFLSDSIIEEKEGWMIDDIDLFWVDIGGNIHENPIVSNIEVYPNPISDKAIVLSKDLSKIENIEIYNINGQLIKQENINNKEYIFEKNEIEPGIYFLKCNFKEGSETVKLIIR